MEPYILIIVVGILIGFVMMMINYARFIHRFPKEVEKKQASPDKVSDETESSS